MNYSFHQLIIIPQVYQEDSGLYYIISSLILFNTKIVVL